VNTPATWRDRLTGATAPTPTLPAMPGQWRYLGPAQLMLAEPGDLLVTDDEGHSPLHGIPLTVPRAALPDPDAEAHLRTLATRLARPLAEGDLDTLLSTAPLIDHGAVDLQPSLLERTLRLHLGTLEVACRQPRTLLVTDEDRLLTARCKRPSHRAALTLAQHPEDWAARLITGVRPTRVLAVIHDEDLDIYENRVIASLIDRLDRALALRALALRRVLDLLQRRADYQHIIAGSPNYRRTRRLLALWGSATDTPELLGQVRDALGRLGQLHRRLRALMDTPLYQQFHLRARRVQLRMTNIFSHDPIYRQVAQLWLALQADDTGSTDPSERWRAAQERAAHFDSFALLVLLRAFEALGLTPDADTDAPRAWSFTSPLGHVQLTASDDAWTLTRPDGPPITVLALPVALHAVPTTPAWRASLPTAPTLILHLDAGRADATMRTFDPATADWPTPIAIAPWDLESVERVARALRWFIWAPTFQRTPPRLTHALTPDLRRDLPLLQAALDANDWLLRPPNGPVHAALDQLHADASHALAETEARINASKKSSADVKHLRQTRDDQQRRLHAVTQLRDAIDAGEARLNAILHCPACHATTPPHHRRLDGGFFRCTCAACGATWGAEPCPCCDTHVPWLLPTPATTDAADGVDATWGCDALALPDPHARWRCPTCDARKKALAPAPLVTRAA